LKNFFAAGNTKQTPGATSGGLYPARQLAVRAYPAFISIAAGTGSYSK
jgi:hypothetical protein